MDTAEEHLRAGNAHFEHSEFDQAEACWQEAPALFQNADNEERAGVCLGNLGVIHHIRGEVDQALDCYQESLAIAGYEEAIGLHQTAGHQEGQAAAWGDLGLVYQDLDDLKQAETCHHRSLDIYRRMGHRRGQADQWGNLGMIRLALSDVPGALDAHRKALSIDRAIGYQEGEARDLGNLGFVYRGQGRSDEALRCFRKALEIAQQVGDREETLTLLASIGLVLQGAGRPQEALGYLEEALRLARDLGLPEKARQILVGLGDTRRDTGDLDAACRAYRDSTSIVEAMRGTILRERHKAAFPGGDRLIAHHRLIGFLHFRGQDREALEVIEQARSRLLVEQLATTPLAQPAVGEDLLQQERGLLAQSANLLAALNRARGNEAQQLAERWQKVQGDLEQLWSQLGTLDPEYVALRRGKPLDYEEIQGCLAV